MHLLSVELISLNLMFGRTFPDIMSIRNGLFEKLKCGCLFKTEGMYHLCLSLNGEEGKEEKDSCPVVIIKCIRF